MLQAQWQAQFGELITGIQKLDTRQLAEVAYN